MSNRPSRSTRTQVSYVDDDPMEGMESEEEEEEEEVLKQGKGKKSKSSSNKRPAVTDSSASGSEESEEEWGRKGKKKAPTKKRRKATKKGKKKQDEESEEEESSELSEIEETDEGDDEDTKGVDFSKILPFEIVAEIFSHLSPRELLHFSRLSSSFHSILTSQSSRSIWSAARSTYNIPTVESATELQLATLLFDEGCEVCGTGEVKQADFYLRRRCCAKCRQANWIDLSTLGRSFPDLHPAARAAVRTTNQDVSLSSRARSRTYAFLPDLFKASEHLEGLEILDVSGSDTNNVALGPAVSSDLTGSRSTRTSRKNYSEGTLTTEEVQKKLEQARKRGKRSGTWSQAKAKELEKDVTDSFTPRVQQYLEKVQKERVQWEKIARTLDMAANQMVSTVEAERKVSDKTAKAIGTTRRKAIESKIKSETGFNNLSFSNSRWKENALVNKAVELAPEEWRRIKNRVFRIAGECAAENLWQKALKKVQKQEKKKRTEKENLRVEERLKRLEALDDDDSDDDGTESEDDDNDGTNEWTSKLLKRPKRIPSKVWKLLLPRLKQLKSDYEDPDNVPTSSDEGDKGGFSQLSDLLEKITFVQYEIKKDYFKQRWKKLKELYSTSRSTVFPLFQQFLHLPTVKYLMYDVPIFATRVNERDQAVKADAVWSSKLDAILEEVAEYGLDVRFHALKLILSNTTSLTESQIDELDIEILNSPDYDDDFFESPSSYLICSCCEEKFGPLRYIVKHLHERFVSNDDFLPDDDGQFFLDLSVEAACAASAVYDLAGIDFEEESPKESLAVLKNALQDKVLVWENQPGPGRNYGVKGETWRELICLVHLVAKVADLNDTTLPAPAIVLRDKTPQERLWMR